jgi:hypothetical protein
MILFTARLTWLDFQGRHDAADVTKGRIWGQNSKGGRASLGISQKLFRERDCPPTKIY